MKYDPTGCDVEGMQPVVYQNWISSFVLVCALLGSSNCPAFRGEYHGVDFCTGSRGTEVWNIIDNAVLKAHGDDVRTVH